MRIRRTLRDERGAEIVEFALAFPVIALLLFGLLYGLFAVAAHVSLAHASSRAVRYASIPTDAVSSTYPTNEDVEARVLDNTPFFTAEACETTVVGDSTDNAPVTLDVACDFPNPLGAAVSGMRNFFSRSDDPDVYASTLEMTSHAEARRE